MPQKPILIAQISDLHIKSPGSLAYGRVDTAAALGRCVAALNEFAPKPDLVVISGDLADTPTSEEYDHLKRLLEPLKLPFVGIPGNHDSRELMRAAFPRRPMLFHPGRSIKKSKSAGSICCCWIPVSTASRMANSKRRRCNGSKQRWPPRQTGPRSCSCTIRRSRPASGTWTARTYTTPMNWLPIVRRHPRVQLIATGHVHRATLTMFAGVPTTICPAPNHAVDLDLAQLREPSFKVEPPAFHLHCWFPGEGFGSVVTHQVPIGDFDGPHPFFGPDGKLL